MKKISTLGIFHTRHFPHSAFSTLRIFHTPHLPHSSFYTLRTPHSALRTLPIPPNHINTVYAFIIQAISQTETVWLVPVHLLFILRSYYNCHKSASRDWVGDRQALEEYLLNYWNYCWDTIFCVLQVCTICYVQFHEAEVSSLTLTGKRLVYHGPSNAIQSMTSLLYTRFQTLDCGFPVF